MTLTPDEKAAQTAGFDMPEGSYLMSGGDDAIRANAVKVHQQLTSMTPRLFARGTAARDTNWNAYTTRDHSGLWNISRNLSDEMTGLPAGFESQHAIMIVAGSVTNVATQIYLPYAAVSGVPLIRSTTNAVSVEWSEWEPFGAAGGGATEDELTASIQHEIRRVQFMHAMGGPIDTGGLAAVALRCDHGLTNFRDKVLPRTKAAGIKVSQAYNPRNWSYAENAGVTASDLNGWVAAGDVEIWNHSASHQGAEDVDKLYDEIVNGKAEIEAELPAAAGKVWGFNLPGVTVGDYMGFGTGAQPDQWNGPAARLMMAHHAVVSAYLGGTELRVLDGRPQDGLDHYGIESRTVAEIKARIDDAIAQRRGLQLMLHPSQLDLSGKLTGAQLGEVLDYIVSKRDAGELVTLSPYELMVADATRPPTSITDVAGLAARLAALEYDSGERDITSLIPGVVSGALHIQRVGSTVWIDFLDLVCADPTSAWHEWKGLLPTGFCPSRSWKYLPLTTRTSAFTAGPARVSAGGDLLVYDVAGQKIMRGLIAFPTPDPAPTTPFGVPA